MNSKNEIAMDNCDEANLLPVAIVGMSCRLPGDATSPDTLWELCSRRRSGWSTIPEGRFNAASYYHPNPDRNGTFNIKGGYFLQEDIGLFDAPFFNLTKHEAESLDPQQRVMLECTYEALENGGITLESLAGDQVGVFVGASLSDYDLNNYKDSENISRYNATACALSLQSNRISYHFNFKGPSMTIDTACSSSLTALHVACQSLRSGESTCAIVGGCHLNILPDVLISMSLQRLFSDAGKCYPFDHRAHSGFGPGEGAGCIVLKPLNAAIQAGDAIRAVIVNSGINQDGRTQGITMPSSVAQERLIRSVYAEARIDPFETGYVEAHGTGTKVGDPMEANALYSVFGKGRPSNQPLLVGSIKSNIGHTEGASGVVSVIKTALMLEKGFILPNCDFEKPNSAIPLEEWNLKVPKKQVPWPRGKTYASINNFGFGGSNAHVVLKKARPLSPLQVHDLKFGNDFDTPAPKPSGMRKIYTLSSHDKETLVFQIKTLEIYLEKHPEAFDVHLMNNLAYTLCQRRNHLSWKVAVSSPSSSKLIEALSTNITPQRSVDEPLIGFVFTGQGAQWDKMGRELLGTYPVFRATMETADECLAALGAEFSLIDELSKGNGTSCISEAYFSQPACTAVQMALTDLLRSWGIHPVSVVGHSSGEIAAAYAACILSPEECMRIAYTRGAVATQISKEFPGIKGAMLAVGVGVSDIVPLLDSLQEGSAVVACINSQKSVTISGDEAAINELQNRINEKGIFNRKLPVSVAYHSPHMRLVSERYLSMMGKINPKPTAIEFHSSVFGREASYSSLTSDYWVDNFVSRVQFLGGLQSLLLESRSTHEKQINTLVEIGPHPALKGPIRDILRHDPLGGKIKYLQSLTRGQNAVEAIQGLAAELFLIGAKLNFKSINFPSDEVQRPVLLTNLPNYPWNHTTKYWQMSRLSDNHCHKPFPRNDILGSLSVESDDIEPKWRNVLRVDDHPWIRHHRVQGNNVYPMTGYLAMVLEAATQHSIMKKMEFDHFVFREVSIGRPLIISDASQVETMTTLRPYAEGTRVSSDAWKEFRIFSWSDRKGWDEHCRGLVKVQKIGNPNPVDGRYQKKENLADVKKRIGVFHSNCASTPDVDEMYAAIATNALEYGPLFQATSKVFVGNRQAIFDISVTDTKGAMPHEAETDLIIHPAALDACVQIVWPLLGFTNPGPHSLYLPSFLKGLSMPRSLSMPAGGKFRVYGSQVNSPSHVVPLDHDIFVTSAEDPTEILLKMDGLTLTPVHDDITNVGNGGLRDLCYKLRVEPCLDFLTAENLQAVGGIYNVNTKEEKQIQILNQVSFYFIEKALKELDKEEYHSFRQQHEKLYRWIRTLDLRTENGRIGVHHLDWLRFDEHQWSTLITVAQSMGAVGKVTCALGEKFVTMLHREIAPAPTVPENNLLEQYCDELDPFHRNYSQAAVCVDKMAHQNPAMEILEIGAGTGILSFPILQMLGGGDTKRPSRFAKYTYTDKGGHSFDKAKLKFQAWGNSISYQSLNISEDPFSQGYLPNSYDLIIACHLSNTTESLHKAMAHVHGLLKPGGKLFLIDWTARHLFQFVPALLSGWWLGGAPDHGDSFIRNKNEWDTLLQEAAFSGIDLFMDDHPDMPEQSSSLIVSTVHAFNELSGKEVALVCYGAVSDSLTSGLLSELEHITGIRPVIEVLGRVDLKGRLCIFVGELYKPVLSHMTPDLLSAIQRLVSSASGILWVIRQDHQASGLPESNMALGLARTLRSETTIQLATLELEGAHGEPNLGDTDKITRVFKAVFGTESRLRQGDMEYVVRNGLVCVPRVIADPETNKYVYEESHRILPELQPFQQNNRRLKLAMGHPGTLDSSYFTDELPTTPLSTKDIEIEVRFVGLNFKDIMIAMGQLQSGHLGNECSGVVVAVGDKVTDFEVGDRICAVSEGAFANYARVPATSAWKVPEQMSFEVAASIPIVFCTAYYSLFEVGRLQPGERILLHAAVGGVGQAAVILAQSIGAEIFATVGSAMKKKFLMETYNIDEKRIFFSRDLSFAEGIRRATDGVGVDVVLNSLAGDTLRATWECIAPFGRFIEIGKKDIVRNSRLEMIHFERNVSFASVDLTLLANKRPQLMKKLLSRVFKMFEIGTARPISPITRFSISNFEEACHSLQTGRSIGKIVIEAERNALVKVSPRKKAGAMLVPEASYIVVGGTGGLGRNITSWLAKKGARHIIVISRSGGSNKTVGKMVKDLAANGVTIVVCQCDISKKEEVEAKLVPMLPQMPLVRGVIYGAMVLRDTLFERMSYDEYDAVVKPKVAGVWNIHHALLTLNYDLDFFITLSSIASVVGNRGQAAYAAGGTFMTAFGQYRNAAGLPCTTIDLAPVQGIGYLAENEQRKNEVADSLSVDWIDETELRGLLAAAIRGDMAKTCQHHCITGLGILKSMAGKEKPFWALDPRFSHLVQPSTSDGVQSCDPAFTLTKESPGLALKNTADRSDAERIVTDALVEKVSTIMMRSIDEIDSSKPLGTYGLDSLITIEVRNWISRELQASLQIMEILVTKSVAELAGLILKKSKIISEKVKSKWEVS
ncbi:hypothetical protein EMCG_08619 [[Emmonsia] crescens]|uniref:Non-reducing polyketide synthase nscA n=1 Tax=[Emmonsia] crescens TaxID=73230 RepID=A0A0G2JAD6_9EURO|nr:hypothetical protein EMCG_08619 [Emmonsia crescens UAMH 3008]